jgi:hypothetical protein
LVTTKTSLVLHGHRPSPASQRCYFCFARRAVLYRPNVLHRSGVCGSPLTELHRLYEAVVSWDTCLLFVRVFGLPIDNYSISFQSSFPSSAYDLFFDAWPMTANRGMEMTTEAIIGLVAIVVGLPTTLLALWSCWKCRCSRRGRNLAGYNPLNCMWLSGYLMLSLFFPPSFYTHQLDLTSVCITDDEEAMGLVSRHESFRLAQRTATLPLDTQITWIAMHSHGQPHGQRLWWW